MTNLMVFGVILGSILQPTVVLSQSQTFRAAIVIYKPNDTLINTPDEDVTENIGNYVKYIQLVKDKADILVFPEFGLTKIDAMFKQALHLGPYSTVVKDVGHQYNNCSDDNLGKIACAARANGVYVVLNLVEKVNAETFFVTDVAIDSTGTISMKCRKQHLNNGTSFKQAPNENSCMFTAKFKTVSTSFAVMYETDIFYAIPDNLRKDNVIMTSIIKNTLPFEYGPSLYAGFALNNNLNLLVSAYSDYKEKANGYGGSGIYLKNGTSTVALDATPGNDILIEEIPLIAGSSSKKSVSVRMRGPTPSWKLAYLKASHVPNSNKSVQECVGKNFCCKLEADIAQDNIEPYKWVVLQNKSTILSQQVDVFICALVKPAATTKTLSFKKVAITSTVNNNQVLQTIPIGVNSNFSLPNFEFSGGQTKEAFLQLLQGDELLSFGMIRIVGKGSNGSSSTGIIIGIVIGLLVVIGLAAVGYWWYKRNRGYMRPGK